MFTAKDVMTLREMTGAGMMDCKKALTETEGNMEKAADYLREKSLASNAKKAGRIAAEGVVDSYVHMGGRIGVLVEVNCETDFVAKTDAFKELVHDIAMQIAAAKPTCVRKEDVDQAEIEKEKEILRAQALNEPKPKPANIIEKMVEGRMRKFYEEVVLLKQAFVLNPDLTVEAALKDAEKQIGAPAKITGYIRFALGEGIEKEESDFAAEVAAAVKG